MFRFWPFDTAGEIVTRFKSYLTYEKDVSDEKIRLLLEAGATVEYSKQPGNSRLHRILWKGITEKKGNEILFGGKK